MRLPCPARPGVCLDAAVRPARSRRAAACLLAAILALLLGTGAAQAQTSVKLVGNTGQTTHSSTSFQNDGGQAFTSGGNAAGYKLTAVDLDLFDPGGTPPNYAVRIVSDASNNPGTTVLGTLTNPASLSTGSSNRFTADGAGIDLNPDTQYWVVLDVGSANSSNFGWRVTASIDEDAGAAAGWRFDAARSRTAASTTWVGADRPYKLAVRGYAKAEPTLSSATVNGTALTVNFHASLNTASTPAGSAFTVTATAADGTARTIAGTSAAVTISGTITAATPTVYVTLASPVAEGETVTVGYAKPSTNPLRFADGTDVPVFSGQTARNVTSPPSFSSATVDGTVLSVTFDNNLDAGSAPASSAFTVTVLAADATTRTIAGTSAAVTIRGASVSVTLASAVAEGETATVSYAKPASDPLKGPAGADVADFSDQPVRNVNVTPPPVFVSATVDGATLTVTFDRDLRWDVVPGGTVFTVTATPEGGTARTIQGTGRPTIAGPAMRETLASAVAAGETVTVSYTKPTGPGALPLRGFGAGSEVESFSGQPVENETAAAPAFSSAWVNGTDLRVTFDEDLDTGSAPTSSAFSVVAQPQGGSARSINGTTAAVTISGATASATLAVAVAAGEEVRVSYFKPSSNPLRDSGGNEVSNFSAQPVRNGTGDTTAPEIESMVANGTTVTFTFSEAMDRSSVPTGTGGFTSNVSRIGVSMGTSPFTAADVLTASLTSAARHDEAISFDYTGTVLQDLAGNKLATFFHGQHAKHAVVNNTPPAFSSAEVNGTTLTITFNGGLATDAGSLPAAGDFAVEVGGSAWALAETNPVAVSGSTVTLTLAAAVLDTDAVTVSYTPGANKLKDADKLLLPVPEFSAQSVTNNTPDDTTGPTFVSAAMNGLTLTVTFNEDLDETVSVGSVVFLATLDGNNADRGNIPLSISGRTATAGFLTAARRGQMVRMWYVVPNDPTLRLKDRSGNAAQAFSNQPVTNNTPPAFSSAEVNGTALTITFDGSLDTGSEPAPAAFTVKGAGADQTPTAVDVSGTKVSLTLGRRALAGETVTVSYEVPEDNPLRDADRAELLVPGFSDRAVTNAQAGQPTINLVRIVSWPTFDADNNGTDDTYLRHDEILVDVEFSEPIEVTGGGEVRLRLQVGNNRKVLGSTGGNTALPRVLHGGRTLRFKHVVQPGDVAANGVFVHTNAQNRVILDPNASDKVVSALTGARADLTTNNLNEDMRTTADPLHKVNGAKTGGNDVGPRVTDVFVNGAVMAVHFDKNLTAGSFADLKFEFQVAGIGGIGVDDPNKALNPTRVSRSTSQHSVLRLELGTGARADESVTLTYTGTALKAPGSQGGRRAPMFRDRAVTNNTGGAAGPEPVRAEVVLTALRVAFDAALDEVSVPAGGAFLVVAEDADGDVRGVAGTGTAAISGETVTVELAEGLRADETAYVNYTRPVANWLRGTGTGNPAVLSFEQFRVETVIEGIPPELLGGSVTQTGSSPAKSMMVLSFNEALDESSAPAAADFAVTVSSVAVTISNVAFEGGNNVVLTLDRLAPSGTLFQVTYTPGTDPIRDVAGNNAATFTRTLTAESAGKPALQSVAVDGARLALAYDMPLDPASLPATDAFTLHHPLHHGERVAYTANSITTVGVEDSTAVLRLAHPVFPCSPAFTVTYTKPATSPLQGIDGTAVDGFMHHEVVNERWRAEDRCATGWAMKAEVGSIILTARRPFATDSVPRSEWFTVAASGGPVTVTGAAFPAGEANKLVLTLSRDIAAGETVTVSYTRPDGASGLWDVDGNQLADIEDMSVENAAAEVPAAPGAPALTQASDTSVEATWTAPDANPPVAGYDIQYRRRGAPDWTDHTHADTATSATIGGLEAGRSYEARVRARNAVGAGEWSEPGAGHTGPARFESAATPEHGRGVRLTFTKDILISGLHTDYTVLVDGVPRQTNPAFWEKNTVGLRLVEPVRWGDTVTVAYTKPSSGAVLRDADELAIESFGPEPVANTVPRPTNSAATGAPTISGTAQVGETLTAATAAIEDADGLTGAVFAYQWLSDDADISEATDSSYTLADSDEGMRVRVRVTFTDDAGHEETLVSAATDPVAPPPLTAAFHGVPASHGGRGAEFSFELRFSENFGGRLPYRKLRDEALTATNARVTGASRVARGQNQRWTITVRTNSSDSVTVTLAATTDCGAAGAICTPDGRPLSNSPTATIQGPSAGDAVGGDAGRDSLVLEGEALEIVNGLTPDEGADALFGGRPLSEARRTALDRLGNRNGRYDLGDLLSWIERCRRGATRCGGTPAGPGPATGAALVGTALVGAAAAGARGNSQRRRRLERARRRRRARVGWALAMLFAAATIWSCTGDLMGPPTAERTPGPPIVAATAPQGPGLLTVEFAPPSGHRDAGVLLELEGPGIETVRAPGLELYQSEMSGPRQIIVGGPLRAGTLVRFRVPDRSQLSLYRVHVLEVAGEDYRLRDAGQYQAVITH
ncbi:SwmB domain-containing protein [Candidatus Palauibacter irciniicola]|uniref:SwmB domain-containing protein n=1 Tax=Candidatus Palauibacter irciniicola TaxID=3056733 RepID=UPI003B02BBEA